MIGRLLARALDRIAHRLMDRDWLHDMWFAEQVSRQNVRDHDPRWQSWIEQATYPERRKGGQR